MTDRAEFARKHIQAYAMGIDALRSAIVEIARAYLDDFDSLSQRVSTFWTCEQSPIGMCVFELDDYGRETTCRFCGGPNERK